MQAATLVSSELTPQKLEQMEAIFCYVYTLLNYSLCKIILSYTYLTYHFVIDRNNGICSEKSFLFFIVVLYCSLGSRVSLNIILKNLF